MWAFGWWSSVGLSFERPTNKNYRIKQSHRALACLLRAIQFFIVVHLLYTSCIQIRRETFNIFKNTKGSLNLFFRYLYVDAKCVKASDTISLINEAAYQQLLNLSLKIPSTKQSIWHIFLHILIGFFLVLDNLGKSDPGSILVDTKWCQCWLVRRFPIERHAVNFFPQKFTLSSSLDVVPIVYHIRLYSWLLHSKNLYTA